MEQIQGFMREELSKVSVQIEALKEEIEKLRGEREKEGIDHGNTMENRVAERCGDSGAYR